MSEQPGVDTGESAGLRPTAPPACLLTLCRAGCLILTEETVAELTPVSEPAPSSTSFSEQLDERLEQHAKDVIANHEQGLLAHSNFKGPGFAYYKQLWAA